MKIKFEDKLYLASIVLTLLGIAGSVYFLLVLQHTGKNGEDAIYNNASMAYVEESITRDVRAVYCLEKMKKGSENGPTSYGLYNYQEYMDYVNGGKECTLHMTELDDVISQVSEDCYWFNNDADKKEAVFRQYSYAMLNVSKGNNTEYVFDRYNIYEEVQSNRYDDFDYIYANKYNFPDKNFTTREAFKNNGSNNYLQIPLKEFVALLEEYSDGMYEENSYFAYCTYKFYKDNKLAYIYYDGNKLWSSYDPTPITEYVYIPMDNLEKLRDLELLKAGAVSLEKVAYGTNYDYVAYKKTEKIIFDGQYIGEYGNGLYDNEYIDELTSLYSGITVYGDIMVNGENLYHNMPGDLYRKMCFPVDIEFHKGIPEIKLTKNDGEVITLDDSWILYKNLKNIGLEDAKLTFYRVPASLYEEDFKSAAEKYKYIAPFMAVISVIMLIAGIVLNVFAIYKLPKKKEEYGCFANSIDCIWLEIFIAADIFLGFLFEEALFSSAFKYIFLNKYIVLKSFIVITLLLLITLHLTVMTIARRIKKKEFMTSLFITDIINWKRIMKKMICFFKRDNLRIEKKFRKHGIVRKRLWYIFVFYAGNVILTVFLAAAYYDSSNGIIAAILFIGFNGYMISKYFMYAINESEIAKGINNVASGKINYRINTDNMNKIAKEAAESVNNIGNGLTLAVNDSIASARKSVNDEKLKAELITNVSKDIKEPLSEVIVNVEKLRAEYIGNERAVEYINILESKSQRLKMLIEDLQEAASITSGDVALLMEKICINETLSEIVEGYRDKLSSNNLTVEMKISREEMFITADRRRLFRVVENLLQNVYRYSLEYTRVYIKLLKQDDKAKIVIMNTSKQKLDIDPEELKERFKRGDESRNSEGNGLGLAICDSLMKLMGGSLILSIDGDLFKAELVFDINNI
ncbi:MAG: HAMP domain-containing histidine kinase [Lachnospiraceae bacterium]|nr:HAMP domain-containing histidine kinase [Lachnospiraceae bacterium]